MEKKLIFTNEYFLTAGECNARGEMPVTLIAERIIEVATNHANHLGIGYADLTARNAGWVLSRMGFEMLYTPRINERYSVTTWVESWNRSFSERCFRFADSEGKTIGWARTIWAAIDFDTRRPVDLHQFAEASEIAVEEECGMPKLGKHGPVEPTEVIDLKFKFMDLDFNRHVNSVRYIEHILNLWPLSHYDAYRIDRFEISYRHECLAGEEVELRADKIEAGRGAVEIVRGGERVVSSIIGFTPSPFVKGHGYK